MANIEHEYRVDCGNASDMLAKLPEGIIQTTVTSPPYFGLRDYGVAGQIGLEDTPEAYVARLVEVFREVRRVLRKDGTLFLNLGDSYYHASPSGQQGKSGERASRTFTAAGAGSQREGVYGTSDKALASYPDRDLFFENLCGACLRDWESCKSRTYHQPVAMPATSPYDPSLERKESERVHLPTLDSLHQRQTRLSSDATQDSAHSVDHAPVLPHASLVSMSDVSSRQSQDWCLQTSNDDAGRFVPGSSSDDAQPIGHRSDAPSEMPHCKEDTALPSEGQPRHIRYTAGYCSRCGTYSEYLLTNTQPQYTTRLSPKQLLGVPWRVAFALSAAGWYLRSDVVWVKPNAMPSSVKTRPTVAHEYIFFFAKEKDYVYNPDAIREPHVTFSENSKMKGGRNHLGKRGGTPEIGKNAGNPNLHTGRWDQAFHPLGRNKRTVWEIPLGKFRGAHFAVFPERLVEICILAGSNTGSLVCDSFTGSGTTGVVAKRLGRYFYGVDLSQEYVALASTRINAMIAQNSMAQSSLFE
jgi:DNA modification methylase